MAALVVVAVMVKVPGTMFEVLNPCRDGGRRRCIVPVD
jgi:hypothetical protein